MSKINPDSDENKTTAIDIAISSLQEWDPHVRRDLIDQLCAVISEKTPDVVKSIQLSAASQDQDDATPSPHITALQGFLASCEKIVRLSFPWSGKEFVMTMSPVVPHALYKTVEEKAQKDFESADKHWIARSLYWVVKKWHGLDKETAQEVDKEVAKLYVELKKEQAEDAWRQNSYSALLREIVPWMAKQPWSANAHVRVHKADKTMVRLPLRDCLRALEFGDALAQTSRSTPRPR